MIHVYCKAQPQFQEQLRQWCENELRDIKELTYRFQEAPQPFRAQKQRSFLFYQVEDDSMLTELKEWKETQGMCDFILITEDPSLISAYASIRLFGWIITSTWNESLELL